ncbi:MAG TPA: hypothetical protein VNG51_10185 [Ktedonobacteraceae bacterium]|nr:hypothetical protein [Ktedonobacteraceae bacterium]
MSNSQNLPVLNIEVPGLNVTAWFTVIRYAVAHASKVADQRTNYEKITNKDHDDWHLLHRFEYEHFYNAWAGVAYRLRACALHSENFTATFQRTQGVMHGEDTYQEDDALFGFFVKGLSALESFYYSLYALGTLIVTSTEEPSIPPSTQFPLLTHLVDPDHPGISPRSITPKKTYEAYNRAFSGLSLTNLLGHLLEDERHKQWSEIRNILAHRVAFAGRTTEYPFALPFGASFNEPPLSVKPWGMDLVLDATTTASRYPWLRNTINTALEETAAFTAQHLPYTEDQLGQGNRTDSPCLPQTTRSLTLLT